MSNAHTPALTRQISHAISARMRKALFVVVVFCALAAAAAARADAPVCYDLALSLFPTAGDGDASVVQPLPLSVCVSEDNVVETDETHAKGDFKVVLQNSSGKALGTYSFSYREIDGAAGSVYQVYGLTPKDVDTPDTTSNASIVFQLTDDNIAPGEQAGMLTMQGNSYVLVAPH
jgi:hypothetical protein